MKFFWKFPGTGKAQVPQTVSAIITTYNYARYIEGSIQSVLAQTRRPDEIVVVDDGSTDNTAEIVARYADQGVRYVYKENGGAGAARNAGIKATTGDLIAFLDGDDRWLPDKIALQLEHLRRNPTAGLITGNEIQVYEETGERLPVKRKPTGAKRMYNRVLVENFIGNPSITLIKRACFDQVGMFDEGMRLGQDWDMWIRIAREFPVGSVNAPLILFNMHRGSLTSGQMQGRIDSNREIRRRYIQPIRSPLQRLHLLSAATSMSYFYSAAAMSDDPTHLFPALGAALVALLLDPTYETKLKAGLLFRMLFGRRAFNFVRDHWPHKEAE